MGNCFSGKVRCVVVRWVLGRYADELCVLFLSIMASCLARSLARRPGALSLPRPAHPCHGLHARSTWRTATRARPAHPPSPRRWLVLGRSSRVPVGRRRPLARARCYGVPRPSSRLRSRVASSTDPLRASCVALIGVCAGTVITSARRAHHFLDPISTCLTRAAYRL